MIQNFIGETSNVTSTDACAVEIWTVPLAIARSGLLSKEETARAARFHSEKDRVYWTNARLALRDILAEYAGESPDSLRFIFNQHGKPALESHTEIEFNLSHAGDYALIAVSRSAPVGVDIERIRPNVDIAALLRRLGETDLPATIPELYQRWTQREARSKAAGGQLFIPPPPDICAIDVPAPEGYAASVATSVMPVSIQLR
jgi:4'-phosphopantetheinyl transferase